MAQTRHGNGRFARDEGTGFAVPSGKAKPEDILGEADEQPASQMGAYKQPYDCMRATPLRRGKE